MVNVTHMKSYIMYLLVLLLKTKVNMKKYICAPYIYDITN